MTQVFTDAQIQEILSLMMQHFSVAQYIGARYVPIFGRKGEDSIEWDNSASYEPLTIVLYQGNSYTSRQYVPTGVDILNQEFWANTGNYNAQVEQYRQEVLRFADILKEKAFVFDNVSDMKAFSDLNEGAICRTNGFYESGDGGAAWYVISNSGVANEMDVIACGSLFANLIVENTVTPEMLGAYGDNIHDDTISLNKAFEYLNVKFAKAKTYLVSVTSEKPQAFILQNNVNIDLNNSTIKLIPHELNSHTVFHINNAENVVIKNGFIIGDKNTHPPVEGQQGGFAIRVTRNAKNVFIDNLVIKNMYGDGIYIGTGNESDNDIPEDVYITNCDIDNARRNGISITNGIRVYINNCKFSNISGQTPQSSIDVEPNWNTDVIDVFIDNIYTYNSSMGFGISNYSTENFKVIVGNVYCYNVYGVFVRLDLESDVYIDNIVVYQKDDYIFTPFELRTVGIHFVINNLSIKQGDASTRPLIAITQGTKCTVNNFNIIKAVNALITNADSEVVFNNINFNESKITYSINFSNVSINNRTSEVAYVTDDTFVDFIGSKTIVFNTETQQRYAINGYLHVNGDTLRFINASAIANRITTANSTFADTTTNYNIQPNEVKEFTYYNGLWY